jgi:hypothetical protein
VSNRSAGPDARPNVEALIKDLSPMVRWYDPRLLARVGVRTVVSSIFGQYADQRLIQAATDQVTPEQLVARYDFRAASGEADVPTTAQAITTDANGAFWVDYVADTGDGFEPTFAVAALLAQERLDVVGTTSLPAGDILIMGGDQCYPQATREGYRDRLQKPYDLAFGGRPSRKLFAIPGNHDWYDGLNAFDSLFCSSRDKLSETHGNAVGGWQCQQHRSYWALRLPHNWWIWGTDIQFSKYLDTAQVNYFRTIAEQMQPGDKLILCMAEPAWMLADFKGQDEEENFFKITTIARRRGVKICAVIAGDWHHYARYTSPELGVHLFTAGGGGSFLHPTHVLKNEVELKWPVPKAPEFEDVATGHGTIKHGWDVQRYDVRLKKGKGNNGGIHGGVVEEAVKDVVAEVLDPTGAGKTRRAEKPLKQLAPKVYPKRSISLFLSMRNFLLPFYNKSFALGIGALYWLMTWMFHTVVKSYDISAGKIDAVGTSLPLLSVLPWMPLYVLQATLSMGFALCVLALFIGLFNYVEGVERPGFRRYFVKFTVALAHGLVHLVAMFTLFLGLLSFNNQFSPWVEGQLGWQMQAAGQSRGVVGGIVRETLEPVSKQRQAQRDAQGSDEGRTKRVAPPVARSATEARSTDTRTVRELVGLLYPLQMILLGGLVGGFIWGAYWVIAGFFGHMHAEQAFAALRIKDYRNFLRMKFEADQVTIFPVGLDRVPRGRDLRLPTSEEALASHHPQVVPTTPMRPHLIEDPIVIKAATVQA